MENSVCLTANAALENVFIRWDVEVDMGRDAKVDMPRIKHAKENVWKDVPMISRYSLHVADWISKNHVIDYYQYHL